MWIMIFLYLLNTYIRFQAFSTVFHHFAKCSWFCNMFIMCISSHPFHRYPACFLMFHHVSSCFITACRFSCFLITFIIMNWLHIFSDACFTYFICSLTCSIMFRMFHHLMLLILQIVPFSAFRPPKNQCCLIIYFVF